MQIVAAGHWAHQKLLSMFLHLCQQFDAYCKHNSCAVCMNRSSFDAGATSGRVCQRGKPTFRSSIPNLVLQSSYDSSFLTDVSTEYGLTHLSRRDRSHNHVTIPTAGHLVVGWTYGYTSFLSFPTVVTVIWRQNLPLHSHWLLSTLQSVGSTRTSAFKNKITIPSHLWLSSRALEAANQQLKVLGGDRHIFEFSVEAQGMWIDAILEDLSCLCKSQ